MLASNGRQKERKHRVRAALANGGLANGEPPNGVRQDVSDLDLSVLYEEHFRSLVKLASMYVDDVETAEEVTQDAFLKMLSGRYKIEPGKEAPYLRSVVLNGARSKLRKRKVRRLYDPGPPSTAAAAEIGGMQGAEQQRLLATMRNLPEKQAAVLILRYYLDLSEAEIAETLGIARGSVKSHAHRGLAKMATLLENERMTTGEDHD